MKELVNNALERGLFRVLGTKVWEDLSNHPFSKGFPVSTFDFCCPDKSRHRNTGFQVLRSTWTSNLQEIGVERVQQKSDCYHPTVGWALSPF